MWMAYISVATGGAIGASLRFGTGQLMKWLAPAALWPWGTFVVNILGSCLMGLVIGWALFQGDRAEDQSLKLFLATGVLGGFTTFSAFSLEIITLIRDGDPVRASLYAGSSVLFGVVAVAFGLWAAQKVFA